MFRHWKGLLAAGLAALVGGTACWARFGETSRLVLRREEVALPAAARPFTIALFSDTHLGRYGDARSLRRVAALIGDQQPDLVVFAGDFFDAYRRDQERLDLDELAAILAEIEAPFGKYAVWGNHDRGGGAHRVYGELMERGGFTLLQNQAVALPDLAGWTTPCWATRISPSPWRGRGCASSSPTNPARRPNRSPGPT